MRLTKKNATFILIVVLVMTVQAARFMDAKRNGPEVKPVDLSKSKGDINAPVKLIEYSDFQCSACKYASEQLAGYLKRFPEKIFVEYRHFPLSTIHPHAIRISVAAECAAKQGDFWPYYKKLFKEQKALFQTIRLDGMLEDFAAEQGLEAKAFSACMDDPQTEIDVREQKKGGVKKGVHATPTFFVNGEMIVGATSMTKRLDELLGEDSSHE